MQLNQAPKKTLKQETVKFDAPAYLTKKGASYIEITFNDVDFYNIEFRDRVNDAVRKNAVRQKALQSQFDQVLANAGKDFNIDDKRVKAAIDKKAKDEAKAERAYNLETLSIAYDHLIDSWSCTFDGVNDFTKEGFEALLTIAEQDHPSLAMVFTSKIMPCIVNKLEQALSQQDDDLGKS